MNKATKKKNILAAQARGRRAAQEQERGRVAIYSVALEAVLMPNDFELAQVPSDQLIARVHTLCAELEKTVKALSIDLNARAAFQTALSQACWRVLAPAQTTLPPVLRPCTASSLDDAFADLSSAALARAAEVHPASWSYRQALIARLLKHSV